MVDTRDLKSLGRKTVPVRVRLAAPHSYPNFDRVGVGFFFLIFDKLKQNPDISEQFLIFCFLYSMVSIRHRLFAERFLLNAFTY